MKRIWTSVTGAIRTARMRERKEKSPRPDRFGLDFGDLGLKDKDIAAIKCRREPASSEAA